MNIHRLYVEEASGRIAIYSSVEERIFNDSDGALAGVSLAKHFFVARL
jgi:hypothetical protein